MPRLLLRALTPEERLHGALLVAAPWAQAGAQVAVDQSQPVASGGATYASVWTGQTFVPSATTSAGAGFVIQGGVGGYSGTLLIELWNDIPANAGASKLASGTAAFSLAQSERSMIDVFWDAVAVAPGSQYFLTLNTGSAEGQTWVWGSNYDAYANGGLWYQNYSGGSDTSPYTGWYSRSVDLTFEEYASTAPVTTPEPASIVLLATGFGAVIGVARRRRTRAD